ncbi:MAG: SIS domain-containing protein [Acidobacteria bacterium]|nr:SIS domain-containing protein [Acidobacteriota bacterium]
MHADDALNWIRSHLFASADVKRRTAEGCAREIAGAAELIASSLKQGGKILLCGNGGSAADCQHMAAEFVSRLSRERERPPMAAIALSGNAAFLTAHSNDAGFEGVFSRQVQALGSAGDILIAISTSGASLNVVEAVRQARRAGLKVVALTGEAGILAGLADVAIRIPSPSTQHIQEAHLAVEHILCHLVEEELFADSRPEQPAGGEAGGRRRGLPPL